VEYLCICSTKLDYMKKMLTTLFLLLFMGFTNLNSSGGDVKTNYTEFRNHVKFTKIIDTIKLNLKDKESVAYHYWDSIPIYSPIKMNELQHMSSDYGIRKHPIYGFWRMHHGIDFVAPSGTSIYSTADGVIYKVRKSRHGYGNQVIIKHSNDYKTRYAHLDNITVIKGQHINKGHIIGTLGTSGLSTGPHLHYEILSNGKNIDPMFFTYKTKENRNLNTYFSTLIALEAT